MGHKHPPHAYVPDASRDNEFSGLKRAGGRPCDRRRPPTALAARQQRPRRTPAERPPDNPAAPATYRPDTAPNSSVEPNPTWAPASAVPLARASAATADATAGATSRLNTDGIT